MPLETLFKAVTAIILLTTSSYFLLYMSDYMDLNTFLSNSLNDLLPFVKISPLVAACLHCPLPYTRSINPANKVKIHSGGQRPGLKCECWVISGYRLRVSAPRPANTDLTFSTKPRDSPWIPFTKSPAPPFSFKIYCPVEGERRRKGTGGWLVVVVVVGGGGTVRQLFTVVLSSYFTRKQCHSFLNSSSWPVSSSVCNTFLHRDVYCTLHSHCSVNANASRLSTECQSTPLLIYIMEGKGKILQFLLMTAETDLG